MNLHLTTPLMGTHNKNVAVQVYEVQHLLANHGYYHDTPDGQYGPLTAQAVEQAKADMGYLHPDKVAGALFLSYLTGTAKPTLTMRAVAAKRKQQAKKIASQTPLGDKVVSYLEHHLGMKEYPAGSNRCPISMWYGLIGPWCAMTGIWAYANCGSKVFTRDNAHKHNWAYVPNILGDARAGRNGLKITTKPQAGNGICYDWPGESPGLADHYGTFVKWLTPGSKFLAYEGNTSLGNDSNGGELMARERYVSNVLGFVVVTG